MYNLYKAVLKQIFWAFFLTKEAKELGLFLISSTAGLLRAESVMLTQSSNKHVVVPEHGTQNVTNN